MSSGIITRWVSVDGAVVEYSRLLAEVTGLCGELSELCVRAAELNRRRGADAVRVEPPPRIGFNPSDAELGELAESVRAQVERARHTVARAARDAVAARLEHAAAGVAAPTASAAERLARQRTSAAASAAESFAAAHAAALARARSLLETEAHRIDDADTDALSVRLRVLAELADSGSVDAVHTAVYELRAAVRDSISRRGEADRRERARGALTALAGQAPDPERGGLVARVGAAADPDSLTAEVTAAVRRATAQRTRDRVAALAAEALRDIGCEVTEETTRTLTARGEAVAPLTSPPGRGYGVRTRFGVGHGGHEELRTTMVRYLAPGEEPAGDGEDVGAELWFCREKLAVFQERMRLGPHGVSMESYVRFEAGVRRALPVVSDNAGTEEQRGRAAAREAHRHRAHRPQQPRQRERGR